MEEKAINSNQVEGHITAVEVGATHLKVVKVDMEARVVEVVRMVAVEEVVVPTVEIVEEETAMEEMIVAVVVVEGK